MVPPCLLRACATSPPSMQMACSQWTPEGRAGQGLVPASPQQMPPPCRLLRPGGVVPRAERPCSCLPPCQISRPRLPACYPKPLPLPGSPTALLLSTALLMGHQLQCCGHGSSSSSSSCRLLWLRGSSIQVPSQAPYRMAFTHTSPQTRGSLQGSLQGRLGQAPAAWACM